MIRTIEEKYKCKKQSNWEKIRLIKKNWENLYLIENIKKLTRLLYEITIKGRKIDKWLNRLKEKEEQD